MRPDADEQVGGPRGWVGHGQVIDDQLETLYRAAARIRGHYAARQLERDDLIVSGYRCLHATASGRGDEGEQFALGAEYVIKARHQFGRRAGFAAAQVRDVPGVARDEAGQRAYAEATRCHQARQFGAELALAACANRP
jgi:hypothetical protein